MSHDGPKRSGRFIKKDSKVLKKIALTEFSFQEICSTAVVSHDNQSRSIIHSKFHDPAHIDTNIKAPEKFDNDLQNENQRRMVLHPLDFTKDWERDKKMRKVRNSHLGDDDEIEFDLETAESRSDDEESAAEELQHSRVKNTNTQEPLATGAAVDSKNTQTSVKPCGIDTLNKGETPRYDSMAFVGKAIKNLMQFDDEAVPSGQPLTGDSSHPPSPPLVNTTKPAAPLPQSEAANEFIPVTSNTNTQENMDPEADAARQYQQRQVEQKLLDEKVTAAIEEAKVKGYRDGYILGEEKAELQARQKTAAIFGKVSDLIQEFSQLKLTILDNVQENFYEICQAMAEALLKREFSIKPEAFATILKRAITETIEPEEFKIRVHPEMYDRVSALGDLELTKTLVKDSEIPLGDFKIESDLSVVDGQVGKLIKDLLEQADLNIFDVEGSKNKKADKDTVNALDEDKKAS
jgi:flagellar biosynthesis/type III secretory pathway protein FliH